MKFQPFEDTPGLLQNTPFPDLVVLRQRFPRPRVADVPAEVARVIEQADVARNLQPGSRIAIAVGSRGIADIAPIVRSLVATLRRYGAEPFIVPAMVSHGGATPEGQQAVLESLGVTQDFVGAPIISSLDVDVLGYLPNGLRVHIDRAAHAADGIIVVNRIKPHTDFSAPIESGLSKMTAIGLGKHAGAITLHSWGVEGLRQQVPAVARFVAAHARILCGLAILENAYDEVAELVVMPPQEIGAQLEQQLSQRAKDLMPRLPWDTLDVLVVDQLGKNISGAGMDPNIIGRMRCTEQQKTTATQITNISVHDLTDESHGNAIGLGLADFTTARLLDKVNLQAMYINGITAGVIAMNSIKIPMVLATDRQAVAAAMHASGRPDTRQIRLARIENTLRLEYILASANCVHTFRSGSDIEVLGASAPFGLEPDGSLSPFARVRVHDA
ncbi:MAG TPA: lactate racemase domain-containing protein [Ktedonobacteraceae bacterium]|nr:lactate racemase domain-containing protein [Ktedonobacteraceae bacterium]